VYKTWLINAQISNLYSAVERWTLDRHITYVITVKSGVTLQAQHCNIVMIALANYKQIVNVQ
jgi:hypothetical protein